MSPPRPSRSCATGARRRSASPTIRATPCVSRSSRFCAIRRLPISAGSTSSSPKRTEDAVLAEAGEVPSVRNGDPCNIQRDGLGFVFTSGRPNRQAREPDGGELTPLVYAARAGSIDAARVLLEAGADVNQVTRYGWSPLLAATQNRNYQMGEVPHRARRRRQSRQQGRLDAALPRDRQPQPRGRRLPDAHARHGRSRVHQAAARRGRRSRMRS